MRERSNAVWYVVIGVLVVVLAGALLFAWWPRDGEPQPPPVSVTPSPSDPVSEPDPGPSSEPVVDPSSEDPGGSPGIDPEDFGGHPPSEIIEPLFP